jgi:hypothetical protein
MTKIRKEKQWLTIFEQNQNCIIAAQEFFFKTYPIQVTKYGELISNKPYISRHRLEETCLSCADDLFRYARYHPVSVDENGEFLIHEFVRASYLLKWWLTYRPVIIDSNDSWVSVEHFTNIASAEFQTKKQYDPAELQDALTTWYRKANELFAISLASVVMQIPDPKGSPEDFINITDLMNNISSKHDEQMSETVDFLYTLRYRLKHQDVYRPILRRLEEQGHSACAVTTP